MLAHFASTQRMELAAGTDSLALGLDAANASRFHHQYARVREGMTNCALSFGSALAPYCDTGNNMSRQMAAACGAGKDATSEYHFLNAEQRTWGVALDGSLTAEISSVVSISLASAND